MPKIRNEDVNNSIQSFFQSLIDVLSWIWTSCSKFICVWNWFSSEQHQEPELRKSTIKGYEAPDLVCVDDTTSCSEDEDTGIADFLPGIRIFEGRNGEGPYPAYTKVQTPKEPKNEENSEPRSERIISI